MKKYVMSKYPNYVFNRQVKIRGYILDFYCPQLCLAIEIDGSSHFSLERQKYDKQRDYQLKSNGIETIRFLNEDVFQTPNLVVSMILSIIEKREFLKFWMFWDFASEDRKIEFIGRLIQQGNSLIDISNKWGLSLHHLYRYADEYDKRNKLQNIWTP